MVNLRIYRLFFIDFLARFLYSIGTKCQKLIATDCFELGLSALFHGLHKPVDFSL